IRPLVADNSSLAATHLTNSSAAIVHRLDLSRSREEILGGFHKSCILRKIRSQRENLHYEEGRTDSLLEKFYRLLLLTRRKHQLPPQPIAWFRNLRDCLNERLS